MEIKFKYLNERAKCPTKGRLGDACFDLYSCEETILMPGKVIKVNTGIGMAIPKGFYGHIESRSGLASKGIFSIGGIIDENYRGDIGVLLANFSDEPLHIDKQDRIAQIGFSKVEKISFKEVRELPENSVRGIEGFGSSGK